MSVPFRDPKLWRNQKDPENRHRYCVQRPDETGGYKPFCISCSIDEELKILKHYTFCAKKADCPTKYTDKPIWNATTRLCEPCDPVEGCLDTGSVRFNYPEPLKPMDCSPRGTEVVGQRTCTCPVGWITDFSQNPSTFLWCNTKDWNHIYNVRRRLYKKPNRDYTLVYFASVLGVLLSCLLVMCFFSLTRKACRKIFPLNQRRKGLKQQIHKGKHVP